MSLLAAVCEPRQGRSPCVVPGVHTKECSAAHSNRLHFPFSPPLFPTSSMGQVTPVYPKPTPNTSTLPEESALKQASKPGPVAHTDPSCLVGRVRRITISKSLSQNLKRAGAVAHWQSISGFNPWCYQNNNKKTSTTTKPTKTITHKQKPLGSNLSEPLHFKDSDTAESPSLKPNVPS